MRSFAGANMDMGSRQTTHLGDGSVHARHRRLRFPLQLLDHALVGREARGRGRRRGGGFSCHVEGRRVCVCVVKAVQE